jgi:chaperonin GroES
MLDYAKVCIREDYLLVHQLVAGEMSAGGIVIPDVAKERPNFGVVLAVGPGRIPEGTATRVPVEVCPGDLVSYARFAGYQLPDAEHLYILREAEVSMYWQAGQVALTKHEAGPWHLQEHVCEVCAAVKESESRGHLADLRAEFQREQAGHLGVPMNVRRGPVPIAEAALEEPQS